MGNKQLIKVIIVNILLILLIISPLVTGVDTQVIWGFISYSDSSWVPNGVVVTATNPKNDNSITTTTVTGETGHTGCYMFADIFLIPGTNDGDTIRINVSYGGCTGNDTVVIDIDLPSQHVDITICCNLPPAIPSQPSGPTSGCTGGSYPYSISTTDPDNDTIKYGWDWNDDTVVDDWTDYYPNATTCNMSHSWDSPGVYRVRVMAQDEHGAELGTLWSPPLNITISGNIMPTADFNYAPSNPDTSDTIKFTDESSDTDGTIVNWTWDFGDSGPLVYDQNPTHNYHSPRSYQVNLTVTDNAGATNTTIKTVEVTTPSGGPSPNIPPTAGFTYTPSKPIVDTTTNFADTSTDINGYIVRWYWNFGDGTNSTEQNPTHIYTQPGSYQVILNVTDDNQAKDTMQKTIDVLSPYNISEKNITTIALKYDTTNKAHKGRNLIAWKGAAINASVLAASALLSTSDSISIFNTIRGQWKNYIVGVSNSSDDFTISTWDVIDIRCTAEKNIIIDISKVDDKTQEITLKYIPASKNASGNNGYNYFVWTSTESITAGELAKELNLSGEPISKYDPKTNTWIGYTAGIGLEKFLTDFTISMYDIICTKVIVERSFTIA